MRLLTLGAIGAAVYGEVRGMRIGTFQQLVQKVPNKINLQNLQK